MEREELDALMEREHEADVLDRASRTTAEHIDDCVQHYRRLAAPEQERLPDGSFGIVDCVDCDEPIEPERVQMARVRCFACQDMKERRSRWR